MDGENLTNTQTTEQQPTEPAQTTEQKPQDAQLLEPQADASASAQAEEGKGNEPDAKDGDLLDADALDKERKAEEDKVPDAYEDFNLPEGFELTGEDKESTLAAFKELGLSQKKAQALVDLHCEFVKREEARFQQQIDETVKGWKQQVRSRPEYETERTLAVRAMRALVKTPEEIALFRGDRSMANNPAMWSLMVKVGRLIGEDNLGRGGGVPPADDRFHVNLATLN